MRTAIETFDRKLKVVLWGIGTYAVGSFIALVKYDVGVMGWLVFVSTITIVGTLTCAVEAAFYALLEAQQPQDR